MASSKTDHSLQGRFYQRLAEDPARRALAFYSASGEFSWLTLDQVFSRSETMASAIAEQGLRRGDVCVLVLNSDDFAAHAVLACQLLGAIPLLVAPPLLQGSNSSLAEILQSVIDRTGATLVLCADSMLAMQQQLEEQHPETRFIFGAAPFADHSGAPPTRVSPSESDIVGMQLTSGTTGMPRICVWKQKSMLAALDGMASAMAVEPDTDMYLNWTPLYHDMGLVNNFLLCLARGIPLVMLKPHDFVKDPALWLRALSDTGATTTWAPNFGFALAAQRVHDDQLAGVRLDHVKGFWNAAERIHLDTMLAFRDRFLSYGLDPTALKTNFGCAENIGGATFSDPHGQFLFEHVDATALHEEGVARPISNGDGNRVVPVVGVGRPHPAMSIQILSEDGKPLPDGHIGEVALNTPSRMEGYLADPDKTREAFVGELLRTGDLGYLRGQELFWVGRVQERITVRGRKIDPSDFERILLKISGLRPGCFTAFGVDDPINGTQRVVLLTEIRENPGRSQKEISAEIRDKVFNLLGLSISDVVLVKPGTLTKTSSGKRRHRHFRELYLSGDLAPHVIDAHD